MFLYAISRHPLRIDNLRRCHHLSYLNSFLFGRSDPLILRQDEPHVCVNIILSYPLATSIHQAKLILPLCIPLRSKDLKPLYSFLIVLSYTFTFGYIGAGQE